ncbi:MAG: tetratricopeptide repeat protein [Spirochaetes bacterium]|nr:tetratricopeptide repeat protein [Spirochaetota bacterium]
MNQKRKNRFTFAQNDEVRINEDVPVKLKKSKKNRISSIETQIRDLRGRKSLAVVIASLVIALAAVFVIINHLYKKPQIFKPSENNILPFSEKKDIPSAVTTNIKIQKGKENYSKGYYSNAISIFNEVVESDAPTSDKAIALTYIGIIHDDRSNYNKAIEYFLRALKYDDKNPITYRNLAIAYRHARDLDSAEKTIKKGIGISPYNVQNIILYGNILYEQGKYTDAIKAYEDALRKKNDPAALHNMALALLKTGKETLAMEYLIKAGTEDKEGNVAHLAYSKLGALYIERKDYESAEKYLKIAGSLNSRDPVVKYNLGIAYLKMKQVEKAVAEFEQAGELGKNDENLLLNLGETYFTLNDYDKSIEVYNRLLDTNKRNIIILSRLAEVYYEKGDPIKALELYQRITTLEPASENARVAYANMGNILDDMGRSDEAIEMYNKALTISSDDDSTLYNMGIAYKNAGKPELAIKTWYKASELNKESPKPFMAIAAAYEEMNLIDSAIEEYQKITRKWETLQEPHFNLAVLYYKKNLFDYAGEEFKKVIELDKNNELAAKSYTNLGIIISRSAGSNEALYEEAQGYIQKALLQKPNDAEALISLGSIYYKRGMLEKAIDMFNLAISSSKDSKLTAEAYNNIGKCYHKKGLYKNALAAFTRGLEQDPAMEEMRINRKVSMQAYEDSLRR